MPSLQVPLSVRRELEAGSDVGGSRVPRPQSRSMDVSALGPSSKTILPADAALWLSTLPGPTKCDFASSRIPTKRTTSLPALTHVIFGRGDRQKPSSQLDRAPPSRRKSPCEIVITEGDTSHDAGPYCPSTCVDLKTPGECRGSNRCWPGTLRPHAGAVDCSGVD